ncbi:twin-arginine translocase subunit TatC [Bacteriovoracaceae bacterium]|nr:twin-arginine translocase subunit TatC [Bacteriovoracaceae bacterium]
MKDLSIVEHLGELRRCLLYSLLTVIISFFACYHFGEYIIDFLLDPLKSQLEGQSRGDIVYLGVLDKVLSQLQVALWSAVIFSSPFWFWQIWRFIRPGLYTKEIRLIRPFMIFGFILFIVGVSFGYYVVFPVVFPTLMSFGSSEIVPTLDMKQYLVLVLKVLILLGLIFQLPNLLIILGFMGVLEKETMTKFRGTIYVGLAGVSAFLTPPDVVTMLGLWLPLVCLFELGVVAQTVIVKPLKKKMSTSD